MASVIFSNAQRIIAQIFDWLQTSGQTKTSNLITDTFSPGIDNATNSGEGFLVVPGTNNTSLTPTVNVTLGGIAYDTVGNRIFISSGDTTLYNSANVTATTNDGLGNLLSTPQNTGVINIPVTQTSLNYLWIDYLPTIDTSVFTLNEITDAKIFYKQTDGYNIQVTTGLTPIPPDANSIFLATIDMTLGGAVASSNISQLNRSYYQVLPNIVPIHTPLADLSDRTPQYNSATTYTLEAHIKAVGTGSGISPFNPHNTSLADLGVSAFDTVQAHRQLEHGTNGSGTDVNNAIIAGTVGNSYPSTSAMACNIAIVNPGSDYIIVNQLLSSEFAIVNGTAYNVNAIFGAVPTNATVAFPATSGTYNLYWDSVTKSFAVTISDISTDPTKIWLCTATYTYVGSGPSDHNSLSSLLERRRIGSTIERYQRWVTTARPSNPLPGEYGFNLDVNAPEYFDSITWQSLTVPTGTMLDFAGSSAPSGFLIANGSAISRTTYANLFTVIGVVFGPGDGSTTFNLPNKQRRVIVGAGGIGTGTLGNTVGSVGGEETHTLTIPEIPNHSHTIPGNIASIYAAGGGQTYDTSTSTTSTSSIGGSGSHNNVQPSLVLNSIIKY